MALNNQDLNLAKRHPDVLHGLQIKGRIGTIIRALRRLLVALGGKYDDEDVTDVGLVEKIAALAENGGISPSVLVGGGGDKRNIWYATCSTASGTGAKTATTSTGDFALATGSMVRVLFTTSNTAANPTISIDGSTAKYIRPVSGSSGMANKIAAGEVVDLVYDGSNFVMTKGSSATTSFYGITKLNSLTSSTSTTEAATPSAVKAAYDLADSAYDLADSKVYGAQVNITSGSHDLDDYKTAGLYYFSTGATITNCPQNAVNGWLTVYVPDSGTNVKQIWQRHGSNPTSFRDFYMRLYASGAWGSWARILEDSYLPISVANGGTGASNANTALTNLKAFNLGIGTSIPNNSNLNNYTTAGVYYCSSGTNAATLTNVPATSSGFKLVVMYQGGDTQIRQIAMYNASDKIFERYRNSGGTWYAWQRFVHTGDLPLSVANGGTGAADAATARTNLGAVNKAGDTMTGNLTVTGASSPRITVKNSDMDTTADSIAADEYAYYALFDKNDKYVAFVSASETTAGLVTAGLNARRVVSGSNVTNTLNLRVAKDGTRSVSVSDASIWRTALGAAPMPTVYTDNTSGSTASVNKTYTVSGSGVVVVFCGTVNALEDFGEWTAAILHNGTRIMAEGTRWATANTAAFGASTSVPISVANGDTIKIELKITKGGSSKYFYRRFLCFGCTVS